ncbi:MAG: redoxin domain-containing protein [Rhodospirillales bacterium]|nr:redoxin domain-containing protein [Rhodospirillales bacterium]
MKARVCAPQRLRRHAGAAFFAVALLLAGLAASVAEAAPAIGEPAPSFTVRSADGAERSLADYAGRVVVLEWTNRDCPYVRKHYGTGNMQALQKRATEGGVVWLTVISSAPGEQGYADGGQAKQIAAAAGAAPSEILLDPDGTMGRAYAAKTTPHMYVIDRDGRLVYMGGIDDRPTTRPADIQSARNYVAAALADLAAGQPVEISSSRPYGCSIKYRPS